MRLKTNIKGIKCCFLCILFSLLTKAYTFGQTLQKNDSTLEKNSNIKKVNIHGLFEITNDQYKMNTSDGLNILARRPNQLSRLIFTPVIQIGKDLTIPINILLSSRLTSAINPENEKVYISNSNDLLKYLQNPINICSIGLNYKRMLISLGTQFPRYTELTMSELPVFGAGFEIKGPGIIFKSTYGYSQQAIEPDSVRNIYGAYKRQIFAVRAGYGNEEKTFWTLNFLRSKDLASSILKEPLGLKPMEGMLVSTDFRIRFSQSIFWTGEIAGSAFTSDLKSPELPSENEIVSEVNKYYIVHASSRADYAGTTAIELKRKTWNLKLKGIYARPGFKSMGNPFFQSDRLDLTLNPGFKLLKGKIIFYGSAGSRLNNLSETRTATMHQLIYSGNLDMQLSQKFSLSFSYANFGIRNNATNDTMRIQNVSRNFSISPTYTVQRRNMRHVLNAMYSTDEFEDYNVVSGALNHTLTNIGNMFYYAAWMKVPLMLGIGVNRYQLNATAFGVNSGSLNLNMSYSFFHRKLRVSYQPAYFLHIPRLNIEGDKQLVHRVNIKYSAGKGYKFALTLNNNNYTYGASAAGKKFIENYVQTSISKEF